MNRLCMLFLCLIGVSTVHMQADVHEILYCYELLRAVSYRTNGAQGPIIEAVKKFKVELPEAFKVQEWPIADDQVAQVGILDMALISLKCQEILLTAFLAQEGQLSPSDIPEFEEYEREKVLVEQLRRQGLEQHLTDGEIAHYAEVVLVLSFAVGDRVS